jgi:hypothetical protein
MDPKLQSTFIPKGAAPHSIGTGIYVNRKESIGPSILGLLSLILFVLAVVAAGGVFGYKLWLSSQIESMGNDLKTARANINPDLIKQITDLNTRINSTKKILLGHTVISPIFSFLETSTVNAVAFTEFHYSNAGNGMINLNLKGLAKGYDVVALQSNVFSQSPFIKNPVFSDLKLNDKGQVAFTFNAVLDPNLVSFQKVVQSSGSTASSTPVKAVTATTTATTTKPTH